MSTFDGWETRLYGDAMVSPPCRELMHFRTKGSKNGVRRYQTESGEWTPLGLKERKAREGWGQSKAERKSAKLQAKKERREVRKERRAAAKAAYIQKRASKSIKNLSDDELQKRINRVKKEIEYKELTKNPLLKAGEKLVTGYFENKDRKLDRDMKRAELIVRQQEARQKTLASKAALTQARGGILDNIMRGAKYKQAKSQLITTKADKTVRGAVRKAISKVVEKEGQRIANDMGDESLVMRAGRFTKKKAKKAAKKVDSVANKIVAKSANRKANKIANRARLQNDWYWN